MITNGGRPLLDKYVRQRRHDGRLTDCRFSCNRTSRRLKYYMFLIADDSPRAGVPVKFTGKDVRAGALLNSVDAIDHKVSFHISFDVSGQNNIRSGKGAVHPHLLEGVPAVAY